jgi:hypothetical protein
MGVKSAQRSHHGRRIRPHFTRLSFLTEPRPGCVFLRPVVREEQGTGDLELAATKHKQSVVGGCQASQASRASDRRRRQIATKGDDDAISGSGRRPLWRCLDSCWVGSRPPIRNPPRPGQSIIIDVDIDVDISITYYLLPITYYLLPITYYLLPITDCRLPITDYLLPIIHHLFILLHYYRPCLLTRMPNGASSGRRFTRHASSAREFATA